MRLCVFVCECCLCLCMYVCVCMGGCVVCLSWCVNCLVPLPLTPQNDFPHHMFFIKRGIAAVSKDCVTRHCVKWPSVAPAGSQYDAKEWVTAQLVPLGQLLAGSYFGESSIMTGTVRVCVSVLLCVCVASVCLCL